MNAKELRRAAEYTVTMWDNHDSKRLVAGDELFFNSDGEPDAVTFARHILSTVRDDDDEPVSEEFVSFLGFWWDGRESSWTPTELSMFAFYAGSDSEWYCSACNNVDIKTRGQFRSLCKGLGIVLKEKTNAE